ncbi:unnamed protein product, partial [Staurois parvus]
MRLFDPDFPDPPLLPVPFSYLLIRHIRAESGKNMHALSHLPRCEQFF